MATSDPIAEIIGDYRAFATMQRDRLVARGIDIAPYPLSHLAVRVADWDLYVHQRTLLERHARTNRENVWNGRPISLIVLAEPLQVLDGTPVSLIELIPPVHQRLRRETPVTRGTTPSSGSTRAPVTPTRTGRRRRRSSAPWCRRTPSGRIRSRKATWASGRDLP